MRFFCVIKKVHWSDCDAAGIAWFANYFRWFEDAEEGLYAAILGRTRQSLLDGLKFGMPRVEAATKYRAPVRAGQTIRVGIASSLENPRRLRHQFEMRDDSGTLLAEGFVRVACVDLLTFRPRDFPEEILQMVREQPGAAERQDDRQLPWV
jgi:acyl-CoA thioester hydrolase